MSFSYSPAVDPGPLRQGELLAGVYLHIVDLPLTEIEEGSPSDVYTTYHPYLLIINNDCDLRYDFQARFPDPESQSAYSPALKIEKSHALLPFVNAYSLYEEVGIRGTEGRALSSQPWRRVRQNQDERYHRIAPAEVEATGTELPEFFLDFKRIIALPTEYLYEGIAGKGIRRLGILPSPYIHDLVHRCSSFQSRVAVPDD